jgi:GH15 family glucan-1,4-alpha-glucosidase
MSTSIEYLNPATLNDAGLGVRSVEILLAGQAESGAFIAAPDFVTYRYSWLRDGAYCARALDLVGQHQAAGRFHRWVEQTLIRHRISTEAVITRLLAGEVPPMEQMLPTRYSLEGLLEIPDQDDDEPWPNYQLDGYGTWLNELSSHHGATGVTDFDSEAVDLAARYLWAAWQTNCYDCWEEFGDGQHAATLAAVASGLKSAGNLLGRADYLERAREVSDSLRQRFVRVGHFRKGATDDRVDANLLALALPFGVIGIDEPIMKRTVEVIRQELRGETGGLYRYRGDTYFGGGEWILLTCWLGWYDALSGNEAELKKSRDWVIAQANPDLELPEQTTIGAQDSTMVEPWVRRWGSVATPLLWSHAMYLILSEAAPS